MRQRIAAIDIGTVTCRMLVAEVCAGQVKELAKEYAITNLGEGVDATGCLSEAAMQRVARALGGFLAVRDELASEGAPIRTIALATSASRDAENADDFARMLAELGIELSVIPGEREAALSFLGAASDFPDEALLVVDVGGGSTEVIAGYAGKRPLRAHSFDVGCRRVTERFLHADPPAADELAAARAWVRNQMRGYFDELAESGFSPSRVVAVAGTATSAVSMLEHMEVYDSARVHGAVVSCEDLAGLVARLAGQSLAQRERTVGLDPKRAPVITAGLLILQEVLDLACARAFTASESDILKGIVLDAAS